jgi:hypothetical protein
VPKTREGVASCRKSLDETLNLRDRLLRADVPDRELQQLFAGVAIVLQACLVDGDESLRLGLPHEHRERMLLEERAIALVCVTERTLPRTKPRIRSCANGDDRRDKAGSPDEQGFVSGEVKHWRDWESLSLGSDDWPTGEVT